MEKNRDKELDTFVKKVVKEVGLEEPSFDFTTNILSNIRDAKEKNVIYEYKPLISRLVWIAIGSIVVFVFIFVMLNSPVLEISWLDTSQLQQLLYNSIFNSIPTISISNNVVYGFLALVFFVYVQIFILKCYIDKEYTL